MATLGQLPGHCDALEQRIQESCRLAGQRAHLARDLGPDLAASPLQQVWAQTLLPG